MGQLNIVKWGYGKSEAVEIIRKLLGRQRKAGMSENDSAILAAQLVEVVWEEGWGTSADSAAHLQSQSPKPHKLSVAAYALAQGFQSLPEPELHLRTVTIALSNVLAEIEVNGNYALNSFDEQLIKASRQIFAKMLDRFNNPPVVRDLVS